MNRKRNEPDYKIQVIIVSMLIIIVTAGAILMFPEESSLILNSVFQFNSNVFGGAMMISVLLNLLIIILLSISKFGKIKLGNCEPEYSRVKWIAMIVASSFGSTTIFWAMTGAGANLVSPAIGIEPLSLEAIEMSVAQNMFYWGPSAWSLMLTITVPVAYFSYVKNKEAMSMSAVVSLTLGWQKNNKVAKAIDIIFVILIALMFCLSFTMIAPLLADIFNGSENSRTFFTSDIFILILLCIFPVLGSFNWMKDGLEKLSNWTFYAMMIFFAILIIVGPTHFIYENMTQSIGLLIDNFVNMSLYTDAIAEKKPAVHGTVYFWQYWICYVPFIGVYIAQISKGRTIRDIVGTVFVFGAGISTTAFGIFSTFTINAHLSGEVDVVGLTEENKLQELVFEVLNAFPFGGIITIVFGVITILLLGVTFNVFVVSAITATSLTNVGTSNLGFRVVWCLILSAIPLALLYMGIDINTMKSFSMIAAVPVWLIMIVMLYGLIKKLKEDML